MSGGDREPEVISDDRARLALLDAIGGLGGQRFTGAEAVARSGLPPDEVDRHLRQLVLAYESELEVTEEGELLYRFDPSLSGREDVVRADRSRRRRAALWSAFKTFFKAWTVVMIIAYAIIYTLIAIAFLVAVSSQSKGGSRRRSSSLPKFFILGRLLDGGLLGRRSRRRRRRWVRELDREVRDGRDPYVLSRQAEAKAEADEDKPGLIERTWFFLFGVEGLERTPLELEKEILTYLRARKGLITNADIVALAGVDYDEADRIGTRLVATYGGEMDLTDEGVAIYRFPDLTVKAHPLVEEQEPRMAYAWQLVVEEERYRRHPTWLMPGLNAFNLVLCWLSFTTFLPYFGFKTLPALLGLVVLPGIFSLSFFALGLVRFLGDRAKKTWRTRRNLRMSLYRLLFERRRAVTLPGDVQAISAAGLGDWRQEEIEAHLPAIAEALRGEVEGGEGERRLNVRRLFRELEVVEALRARTDSSAPVGAVIFASHGALGDGDPLAAAIEALEPGVEEVSESLESSEAER